MKNAAQLFLIQALLYSVVVFSWRAVATANIAASVLTDFGYALLTFTAIKRIADSDRKSKLSQVGYALGSAAGTWVGIVVSLKVFGK